MPKLYFTPHPPVKRQGACTFSVLVNGAPHRIRGENFEDVMAQIRALCPGGKLMELVETLARREAV